MRSDSFQPLWKIAATAFAVTWLNPQALIEGTLMLGAFRASIPANAEPYFIIGFTSASFLWFSFIAFSVYALGSRLNSLVLIWLNRICGSVIILYGMRLGYSFFKM